MLLLAFRLGLALVFGLAGIGKLMDVAGSRRSFEEFGVPRAVIGPMAWLLPIGELAVAVLLLPASTALAGAVGALGLLAAFLTALGRTLARGQTPECHCFGQIHSEPVGRAVVVRNVVLAAVAAFVAIAARRDPGPSAVAWLAGLTAFQGAMVAAAVAALGLLISIVVLQRRVLGHLQSAKLTAQDVPGADGLDSEDLAPDIAHGTEGAASGGAPVPVLDFELPSLDGGLVSRDSLLAPGLPLALVFVSPTCGSCAALLPRIAAWQQYRSDVLTVAVVSTGTKEANVEKLVAQGVSSSLVLLDDERALPKACGAGLGTPSAVLVNPDGTRAGQAMASAKVITRRIEGLIEGAVTRQAAATAPTPALARPTAPSSPQPAATQPRDASPAEFAAPASDSPPLALFEPAPPFTLPSLAGPEVSLSDSLGMPTALVFWNPTCGYCRQTADDIRGAEVRGEAFGYRVLIVAAGKPDANAGFGFRSPVLLDPAFSVAARYQVVATPGAALIDARGRLVSAPATGKKNLLAALHGAFVAALPADTLPVKSADVEDQLLPDGSMILYNTRHRRVLTLNSTGALIWECCDGATSIAAIVHEVVDAAPDASNVGADVRTMLATLSREEMISLGDSGRVTGAVHQPQVLGV